MYRCAWALAALVLLTAGQASAASREVQYGPAPAWTIAAPTPTGTAAEEGAPLQTAYFDWQTRVGPSGSESYSAFRVKLLTPESLSAGNLALNWSPISDDLTVHRLKIIRGDRVIDVLQTSKFTVIQRENNLDYAMLDGDLTATLQAPGLQVGDELEFAATIRSRDPTLGDRANGFLQLPMVGSPGAYRLRLVWPAGTEVRWSASPDLEKITPAEKGTYRELVYELRDPKTVIVADAAPMRLNIRRLLEYSTFSSWSDVSNHFAPVFEKASVLKAESPVRAEAAKIAAATSDPVERAEAALKLVQEGIRYVYIGLDGGNYQPANADDTWTRRFGDCKAKTVLLIALLRELGIESEAVLVNSKGGDGTDRRLPTPGVFDHVVVRAVIGGKTWWLDGVRAGDRRLASIPAPPYRWVLPIRAQTVSLEAVTPQALAQPETVEKLEVDATAGFKVRAKIRAEHALRGDEAFRLRTFLASLSAEDRDRAQKAYWRQEQSWIEPATVTWRYDDTQKLLILGMSGDGKPDWEGDDDDGRSLDIYAAGFSPPAEMKRPSEQDQSAPWSTDFPAYSCSITVIKLPVGASKWRWDYLAAPVNARLGGVFYWRKADLQNNVMRTALSTKTYLPEISATQARELNDQLPRFNNKVSMVYQTPARGLFAGPARKAPENPDTSDWMEGWHACAPPEAKPASGTAP